MDTTSILAQVLGIVLGVVGLSMLVNRKAFMAALEEMARNQGVLWLYGFVALIFGAFVISVNNIWTGGTALGVTIIGWLALIKGAVVLLFPSSTISLYKKANKSGLILLIGLVALIIGIVLLVA